MKEPENVDVGMEVAVDEDTDAPKTKTDIRLKSPERKKATKRSTASHDEEPSAKRIAFEDDAMEENDCSAYTLPRHLRARSYRDLFECYPHPKSLYIDDASHVCLSHVESVWWSMH